MTRDEVVLMRRRRGHWLRLARGEMLQGVLAHQIGLSEGSGSSISAWESGKRDPSISQMHALARALGIPVKMLAEPEPTDAERVADARAELARAAISLAMQDVAQEAREGPDAASPPDEPRDRRLA